MLNLGFIGFTAPYALLALAALPALWWLLRLIPPRPKKVNFPPMRILADLMTREETPQHLPPWLLLLRLLIATLIILALAGPVLNPRSDLSGSGPLVIIVDNGWSTGHDWDKRETALSAILQKAEREARSVMLLPTAADPVTGKVTASDLSPASDVIKQAAALSPRPWPSSPAEAVRIITNRNWQSSLQLIWLSDGLGGDEMNAHFERLDKLGYLTIMRPDEMNLPLLVGAPVFENDTLIVPVQRAETGISRKVAIRGFGAAGQSLVREEARFAKNETQTSVRIDLPTELRDKITRFTPEAMATAGSVFLLDERWRRRPVGIDTPKHGTWGQPLLDPAYYVEKALAPYHEVRRAELSDLMSRPISVLVMPDRGALTNSEINDLTDWLDQGGVLIRFAGPHLAQNPDTLLPVDLLGGDRALGGAMSWSKPIPLKKFTDDSPYAGLGVPDDVTVSRQVLATPSSVLGAQIWAKLEDDTPLVSAIPKGAGWLVLVHTTANAEWSELALSGLFVNMMRRTAQLARGVAQGASIPDTLPADKVLDAAGMLEVPGAHVYPLPGEILKSNEINIETLIGPRHPPGLYGKSDFRYAFNLGPAIDDLAPLPSSLPDGVAQTGYVSAQERNGAAWLLAAALSLFLFDWLVTMRLIGLIYWPMPKWAASLVIVAVLLPAADPAQAADQADIMQRSLTTHLAYVITGNTEIDQISEMGLTGLSDILFRRTSVEIGGVVGVDIETDELSVFPLIYWPLGDGQKAMSDDGVKRLNSYLNEGGMILFDTREGGSNMMFNQDKMGFLSNLGKRLDVPPLSPIEDTHVLTKAFYLLQEFPGRWTGGDLWVEARDEHNNDGVTSVLVGSHDWAAAWAIDERGRHLYNVVPGGERQREFAYRFGVNLVMVALTGSYKADQVHIPAILQRLGQ